jgi:hypothetical protein
MNENVSATVVGLNETKTFLSVEPLCLCDGRNRSHTVKPASPVLLRLCMETTILQSFWLEVSTKNLTANRLRLRFCRRAAPSIACTKCYREHVSIRRVRAPFLDGTAESTG